LKTPVNSQLVSNLLYFIKKSFNLIKMKIKPKLSQALTLLMLFAQLCASSSLWAQDDLYGNETLLKTIKIGPHPIYTRILVDLNKPVDYQFDANFREKKIVHICPK